MCSLPGIRYLEEVTWYLGIRYLEEVTWYLGIRYLEQVTWYLGSLFQILVGNQSAHVMSEQSEHLLHVTCV